MTSDDRKKGMQQSEKTGGNGHTIKFGEIDAPVQWGRGTKPWQGFGDPQKSAIFCKLATKARKDPTNALWISYCSTSRVMRPLNYETGT